MADAKTYRWANECEARCPAMARRVVELFSRKFQFCRHHGIKVKKQYADQLFEEGWEDMDAPVDVVDDQEEALVGS